MSLAKKTIKVTVDTDDNKAPAQKKFRKTSIKKTAKVNEKKPAIKKKVATKKKKVKKAVKKAPAQKIAVIDEDAQVMEKTDKKKIKKINEKANSVTKALEQSSSFVKQAISEEKAKEKKLEIKEVNQESDFGSLNSLESETTNVLPKSNRSVAIYRNIAFSFIALTIVLVFVVVYFLLIKVTVVIVPNQERISSNIIFDVKDPKNINGGGNIIPGLVEKNEFSLDAVYHASGEDVVGKEAVGEAIIINNYNRNQPLVATTRLLTVNGELFRLKNTINVPAGESVTAEIYADEPSADMAIGPTKFTIPGLWAGLQDKIYAETKEVILYREKVDKYVLESDLDGAVRDLKQKLLLKAKNDIESNYEEYKELKYRIDENSIKTEIEAEVNDEINEFTASISADIVIVAFDEKASVDLSKQKFIASLSPDKEVIEFNDSEIIYSLNNYDYLAKEATLSATFEGKVSIRDNAEIIDVEKIKGLNQAQLDAYLKQIKNIAGYEIIFYPGFLPDFLKQVPKLSDRIEILIRKK
ncbi:MAG: hypothetical protein U9Q85_03340 [Patescibacteria group bacterium]|nr:hypothetical protein [Patescibacteria group bacterium]